METKLCIACNKEKTLDNFYFRNETGKYRSACKQCKRVITKEDIVKRANADTKICKTCGIEKPVSEYQKAGKWLQPYCKPCDADRKRKHTEANKDKITKRIKAYYEENKDAIKIKTKEYVKANIEIVKERSRLYREKNADSKRAKDRLYGRVNRDKISMQQKRKRSLNPEYYKEKAAAQRAKRTPEQIEWKKAYDKEYKKNNKDKYLLWRKNNSARVREQNRIRAVIKTATDPNFKILKRLRGRIYCALNGKVNKSDTTVSLLGCSIEYFRSYFESLFYNGMTWNDVMNGSVHIDHKKPCKLFDLSNPQEQAMCFHYTNLQPLWAIDNLKKGIKYD